MAEALPSEASPPTSPESRQLSDNKISQVPAEESQVTETMADDGFKASWMKSKLHGVRKLTNKERRRRQNEQLRRLLTPKNAVMVLNEILPKNHVHTAQQAKLGTSTCTQVLNGAPGPGYAFCMDLTIDGQNYKGYGDNKLSARNSAAEQAIRDIIIKRISKTTSSDSAEDGEEEEPLPMIQLASYALHKLFAEWEQLGHRVPLLKPNAQGGDAESLSEGESAGGEVSAGRSKRKPKLPKVLPANAASMHPCMLLTYMRPSINYREMAVTGDRPQNLVFTLGLEVDGQTFLGKAPNKRDARKAAARQACLALFNVVCDPDACDTAPAPTP